MDQRGRLGKRGCAVQRSHHEVQNPNTEEIVKAKLHMVADFFKIYFFILHKDEFTSVINALILTRFIS